MSTEAKIDGVPCEASVDEKPVETKNEEIKEEKKMKKSGKVKKVLLGVGAGLLAAGAGAVAVIKVLAAKDSRPEMPSDSGSSGDTDDSYTEV